MVADHEGVGDQGGVNRHGYVKVAAVMLATRHLAEGLLGPGCVSHLVFMEELVGL